MATTRATVKFVLIIYVLVIYLGTYLGRHAPTRWCKGWQYRVIIERAKHTAVRVIYIHVTWAGSGHHLVLNQTKTWHIKCPKTTK